jgi:archaemetzincin
VIIQPFESFSVAEAEKVCSQIKGIIPKAVLRPPMPLPGNAYYPARNRYRADGLIEFLDSYGSADSVVIGLTNKDISTTKGKVADWGVMGLAYRPGNACVVSTFRLSKRNQADQFFKVAIHELGHTQGLPHCSDPVCFMRDAEGGNPTDEEKGFCVKCKSFLRNKGWILQ